MLVETLVWPGFVIVVEELLEDGGEVLPAEDQEVVEQLPTNGTDPALRVSVGSRAPKRESDELDALAGEDLVEGTVPRTLRRSPAFCSTCGRLRREEVVADLPDLEPVGTRDVFTALVW